MDRKFLSDMLHRFDEGKRLESILTEEVFKRKYGLVNLSEEASYGWMKSAHDKGYGSDWYLCLSNGSRIPWSTKQLMRKYKNSEDRFFVIHSSSIDDFSGEVDFKVYGLELKGEKLEACEDADISSCLVNKINEKIRKLRGKSVNNWIYPYLCRLSDHEIANIYIGRCLMDFALKFPKDIDAIDVKDNKVVFYEFKRKDSATSYYELKEPIYLPKFGRQLIKRVNDSLPDNAGRREIDKAVTEKISCIRKSGECFGLDFYSHTRTVIDCVFKGIEYVYIIWNRSPSSIEKLVSHNLEPKDGFYLCSAVIDINSFCGFNYTDVSDNGSIHRRHGKNRKARFQNMIAADLFKPVNELSQS